MIPPQWSNGTIQPPKRKPQLSALRLFSCVGIAAQQEEVQAMSERMVAEEAYQGICRINAAVERSDQRISP
jgi:hypothetical protein